MAWLARLSRQSPASSAERNPGRSPRAQTTNRNHRTWNPWKALVHLKEALNLTDREFAHTLGISERTLSRKRGAGNRLNLLISDRLFRLARISAMAIDIFETPQEAAAWLKEPQFGLGERTPLDLLRTELGAREVEDLLGRLKHGVLA